MSDQTLPGAAATRRPQSPPPVDDVVLMLGPETVVASRQEPLPVRHQALPVPLPQKSRPKAARRKRKISRAMRRKAAPPPPPETPPAPEVPTTTAAWKPVYLVHTFSWPATRAPKRTQRHQGTFHSKNHPR